MYFVYILYSKKLDKYYKGYTNDLVRRLEQHNSGSQTYTRQGVPWKLILVLSKSTKNDALELERKLKNLNKDKLEQFIKKYKD